MRSKNQAYVALSVLRASGRLDGVTTLDLPFRTLVGVTDQRTEANRLIDLEPLRGLTALRTLSLNGVLNEVGAVTTDILDPLATCTALEDLDLSNGTSISELSPLASCRSLHRLVLSGCSSIEDLGPLAQLQHLSELSLTNCVNLRTLEPLRNMKSLRVINVSGCTQLDASALASCSGLQKIVNYRGPDLPEMSSVIVEGKQSLNVETLSRCVDDVETLWQIYRLSERMGARIVHNYSGLGDDGRPKRNRINIGKHPARGPELALKEINLHTLSVVQTWHYFSGKDHSYRLRLSPSSFRHGPELWHRATGFFGGWSLHPFSKEQNSIQAFEGLTVALVGDEWQRSQSFWQGLIERFGGKVVEGAPFGIQLAIYGGHKPEGLARHVLLVSEARMEEVAKTSIDQMSGDMAMDEMVQRICIWMTEGLPSSEVAEETNKTLLSSIAKRKSGAPLPEIVVRVRKASARIVSYLAQRNHEKAQHELDVLAKQIAELESRR